MKFSTYCSGATIISFALTGCASVPVDRGASVTNELVKARSAVASSVPIAADPHANAQVSAILSMPIGVDAAVRLALLQNPRMRELYGELGFAQAEVYDATRLSNPVVGYLRLSGNGAVKTNWSLSQSFTELLFIRYRSRLGRSQLLQVQQRAANEVLSLEADVRAQYYRAVGANLVAQMRSRAAESAQASAQYAQRLYDAGNISELQRSREQAAAALAQINQHTAMSEAMAARGALLNLLGLSIDNGQIKWVETLPLPVAQELDVLTLQSWALDHRLDLTSAKEAATMWTTNATHARRWRWLGGVSLNAERETEPGGDTLSGPGATVELPLFNQGSGNALRSRVSLELAAARTTALALSIHNDIAVRSSALKMAADNADRYRREVVPLQERIVELTQQQQNFMLIGTFELLTAKQQELDSYQAYLEAVRDYWIAHAELMRTAGGSLPGDVPSQGMIGVDMNTNDANDMSNMPQMNHSGHDSTEPAPKNMGDTP